MMAPSSCFPCVSGQEGVFKTESPRQPGAPPSHGRSHSHTDVSGVDSDPSTQTDVPPQLPGPGDPACRLYSLCCTSPMPWRPVGPHTPQPGPPPLQGSSWTNHFCPAELSKGQKTQEGVDAGSGPSIPGPQGLVGGGC